MYRRLFQRDISLRFEFDFHSTGPSRKYTRTTCRKCESGVEWGRNDVHVTHLEDSQATKDRAALIPKQRSRYARAFAVSTAD